MHTTMPIYMHTARRKKTHVANNFFFLKHFYPNKFVQKNVRIPKEAHDALNHYWPQTRNP